MNLGRVGTICAALSYRTLGIPTCWLRKEADVEVQSVYCIEVDQCAHAETTEELHFLWFCADATYLVSSVMQNNVKTNTGE
jgi:hypothetical protein